MINNIPVVVKTKKDACQITGTLSNPEKMPCKGTSLPAQNCITGSKLAKIPGSVCYGCYALKGRYMMPNVQDAMKRRAAGISHPHWVAAMVKQLDGFSFFRWHDSGDIQSLEHCYKIFQVCEDTPDVQHWLPTKEVAIIKTAVRNWGGVPDNLLIRISAPMVDQVLKLPASLARYENIQTSSVADKTLTPNCPAPNQDGFCADCRRCWSANVSDVTYKKH